MEHYISTLMERKREVQCANASTHASIIIRLSSFRIITVSCRTSLAYRCSHGYSYALRDPLCSDESPCRRQIFLLRKNNVAFRSTIFTRSWRDQSFVKVINATKILVYMILNDYQKSVLPKSAIRKSDSRRTQRFDMKNS